MFESEKEPGESETTETTETTETETTETEPKTDAGDGATTP